ncbi:hypothetical protein [Tropicimonas marinistellae]|uniref:hypothetical protein n=1 Tax=Tropicimonas marinistellae TaxID=1739787 RepID=UPI0008340048|nr:hypothetical protein [Tropicimonas marinistellae]
MPARKKPLTLAQLDGSAAKDPQRYRDRAEPKVVPLGAAPSHLTAQERTAWAEFSQEAPWLAESDRALVASACALRAQIQAGEFNAALIRELRMHLTPMGMTPTSRQGLHAPEEPETDDPWAQFDAC